MTFSFDQSAYNYYMQINRDARFSMDGIDDDFDEEMFPNDNEHGTGDPGQFNDSIDDDNEQSNPFDDDSAPFDFDEEDPQQEEPDYNRQYADDTYPEPMMDTSEEDEDDDDGSEQDPSVNDVHDEVDVEQETDVRREIEQEDDIDQTEETVIDEPVFYPNEDEYDTNPTDEEEEIQEPVESFIESEFEQQFQNYPGDELDEADEFFNTNFSIENAVPIPEADEAEMEITFEDFYDPGDMVLDQPALDIHDPFDDVFADIFPNETLGDEFFQLFDNDFLTEL